MKASSESGLWAMLISRTCEDGLPPECFASCSEITVIFKTPNSSKRPATRSLRLCNSTAMPSLRHSSSHHHLNHFGKQKPVKTPAEGLRHRMRQNREPAHTSGEKH